MHLFINYDYIEQSVGGLIRASNTVITGYTYDKSETSVFNCKTTSVKNHRHALITLLTGIHHIKILHNEIKQTVNIYKKAISIVRSS